MVIVHALANVYLRDVSIYVFTAKGFSVEKLRYPSKSRIPVVFNKALPDTRFVGQR